MTIYYIKETCQVSLGSDSERNKEIKEFVLSRDNKQRNKKTENPTKHSENSTAIFITFLLIN